MDKFPKLSNPLPAKKFGDPLKKTILKTAIAKQSSPSEAEYKAGRAIQQSQIDEQKRAGKKGPYLQDNIMGAIDKYNKGSTSYNRPLLSDKNVEGISAADIDANTKRLAESQKKSQMQKMINGVAKSVGSKGAFINTKTPKNAAGELVNPTAKDVADFNAKYTTTFPGRK